MILTSSQVTHRPEVDDDGHPILIGRVVRVAEQYGSVVAVRMDGWYLVRIPSTGKELDLRIGQFEVMS